MTAPDGCPGSAWATGSALPLDRVYLACASAAFMPPGRAKAAVAGARMPVVTATGRATLNLSDGYSVIEPRQVRDLARQVSMLAVEEAKAIVLSCRVTASPEAVRYA